MKFLRVVNLKKYQHYKERRPPWVKLHRTVFSDYAFSRLQDASKSHLMLLWLLASEYDNQLPHDAEWIGRKIDANSPVDIDELVSAGFLEVYEDASVALAPRKQDESKTGSTEDRGQRTEPAYAGTTAAPRAIRISKKFAYPSEFDATWVIYPDRSGDNPKRDAYIAWQARVDSGVPTEVLHAGTERYRTHCEHEGIVGTRFVMQGKKFYGPSDRYLQAWTVPNAPPKSDAPRVLKATEMILS